LKQESIPFTYSNSNSTKAILVGVRVLGSSYQISLNELRGLAVTAEYQPVAELTQKLTEINPKTFLGSGKVEELKRAVSHHSPEVVVFDEELSPRQNRELEKILKCRVIDRPWLILEIFSDHARTREAKTQVELARLKYALPRLTKMWGHLSRQRGGIGMKDVGETQIQLDQRMIRNQINKLEKKLKQIDREKNTQRKSRQSVFKVALVGYTNVGKSSLMNKLTGAETLVENKLFATLDSTVRKIKKNFPYPVLLSDTVGLINKIPHDLVASFKSTLDEVRNADLLIHVVDISHHEYHNQMQITNNLLIEMKMDKIDVILVFNKTDSIEDIDELDKALEQFPSSIGISCKKNEGIDMLRQQIINRYEKNLLPYQLNIQHSQARFISQIRKFALIVNEDYEEDSICLSLRLPPGGKMKLKNLFSSG
tara:strand:+ start:2026 stop:3300 length:1275 start_codon:yes stop_codon:yes gene_type:complete